MIEILGQSTETCLVVHFSGKVTGEEYQKFLDAVDERLMANAAIGLVVELAGFEFYGDLAAARKDAKFAFNEYKRVRRAALVGDQKWVEWFTRLINPFTRAEEKHFPEDQLEAAARWACA